MTKGGGGGNGGSGVIFSMPVAGGALTYLHLFTGSVSDGATPYGSLTLSDDGSHLYGMTYAGGSTGYGTIFKISTSFPYTFNVLYSFGGLSNNSQGHPYGNLVGGNPFYGMTYTGGTDPSQGGILFSFVDDTVTHTLNITETGAGTVTSVPPGINCGSTCSAPFSQGAAITLTAAAATGSTFAGWSGGGCSTGTCKVTMSSDVTVTANFTLNNYTLTATITGTGSGTIAATNLSCNGPSCSGIYPYNTQVNITASPATGSTFAGWTGCDSTGFSPKAGAGNKIGSRNGRRSAAGKADPPSTSCTVTMSTGKSVSASFTLDTFAITATASPAGYGTVSPVQQVAYGGTATITMSAKTGYDVYSITDNGTPVTVAKPYVIHNVTGPHTVVVTFSGKGKLTVGKAGSGSGSVVSAPQGITCVPARMISPTGPRSPLPRSLRSAPALPDGRGEAATAQIPVRSR